MQKLAARKCSRLLLAPAAAAISALNHEFRSAASVIARTNAELGAADDNRTKHAKLVVDHAGLGAAAQIRSFLAQSERSSAAPAEPRNVLGSYLRLSV